MLSAPTTEQFLTKIASIRAQALQTQLMRLVAATTYAKDSNGFHNLNNSDYQHIQYPAVPQSEHHVLFLKSNTELNTFKNEIMISNDKTFVHFFSFIISENECRYSRC